MIRLIAFDLDNTLAPLGEAISPETLSSLKALAAENIAIAVCSGKPTYYLCGMMRQAGLEEIILIGENGGVIQMGVDLPPKAFHHLPYSEEAKSSLALLKSRLEERLPQLWYQPSQIGVTPFPKTAAEFQLVEDCIRDCQDQLRDITVYRHCDAFDIVPTVIDKGAGIRFVGELLHIPPEEMAAVGDGVNDYPMFRCVGHSVGIHVPPKIPVDFRATSIQEAMAHLLALVQRARR